MLERPHPAMVAGGTTCALAADVAAFEQSWVMTMLRIISTMAIMIAATSHALSGGATETPLSARLCDPDKLKTNAYVECLRNALTMLDRDLGRVAAEIRASKKVREEIEASDIDVALRQRWNDNHRAAMTAFRSFRDVDCRDAAIAEAGYGFGAEQFRLACAVDRTGARIDELKARYELP